MSEETKLPEYVEDALNAQERACLEHDEQKTLPLDWRNCDPVPDRFRFDDIRTAIARFASEAAAKEQARSLAVIREIVNLHRCRNDSSSYGAGWNGAVAAITDHLDAMAAKLPTCPKEEPK